MPVAFSILVDSLGTDPEQEADSRQRGTPPAQTSGFATARTEKGERSDDRVGGNFMSIGK
jgi:hypothetical protein